MIERLDSSLPGFKTLRFHRGMNVLLAEKSPGATERQTRNGAGKTSVVELVHFLLGGDANKDHFLRRAELAESSFSMRFDLGGARVDVERVPAAYRDVIVDGKRLANTEWKALLGREMFGLSEPDAEESAGPSFRSLISYFARRQNSGGFHSPELHTIKQPASDAQIALSYLFGLDAEIPRRIQELKERENALKVFRKAAKDGAFGELVGKASDLRTRLAVQESRTLRLREQLHAFQVVPQYREYEREASEITAQLAGLTNDNQLDLELIAQLEEAIRSEAAPRFADVERAYAEAGMVLPELVQKRFEDVQRFHRSIIENRRSHLGGDLADARRRIEDRDRRKLELDARRAQLMSILQSGGALEQFAQLQAELGRMESQTESVRKRFEAAEALERNKAKLDLERARLHRQLQDDHHERKAVIDEAINVFEDLSNELYEEAGSLTVSDSPGGPRFEVRIHGELSTGINKMQIYCFDMTLMELSIRRGRSPGFLIHDSHLFDGVDERQAARALQIGARRAESLGFQYIVMMNEDAVPRAAFDPGFAFDEHVNPVGLTDASETGGLFGRRFA